MNGSFNEYRKNQTLHISNDILRRFQILGTVMNTYMIA